MTPFIKINQYTQLDMSGGSLTLTDYKDKIDLYYDDLDIIVNNITTGWIDVNVDGSMTINATKSSLNGDGVVNMTFQPKDSSNVYYPLTKYVYRGTVFTISGLGTISYRFKKCSWNCYRFKCMEVKHL